MRKPDRSKVIDLFGNDDIVSVPTRPNITGKATKPNSKKVPAMQANKERFLAKLEEEAFHEFDYKEWYQYFVWKAKQHGVPYLTRNYAKEYAILKSLMNELSWLDIKNMIDFLFDSDQDIIDKRTIGLWALSKGWINTIYQNTQLWIRGEYKPKNSPKRNREWIGNASEASRKSSGTGLYYGKPIKEEKDEKKETKRIKKGNITL